MKILYYNWTPFEVSGGGGVAVYIKNLFAFFYENKECGIEPVFLSSGYYYDKSGKSYIRQEADIWVYKSFTIVNSPIIAPQSTMVSDLHVVIKDEVTKQLIDDLISQEGPFDVIHFETFEGISSNVLSLKEKYPATKFVHSIHDYGIICANVRLWNIASKNCLSYSNRPDCCHCMKSQLRVASNFYKNRRPVSSCDKRTSFSVFDSLPEKIKRKIRAFMGKQKIKSSFRDYYKHNIDLINQYSDAELCVSKRVAEIVREAGIDEEILKVDYIGTKVAQNSLNKCLTDPFSDGFTILYMGYANKEKGFFTFMEALDLIGEESSSITIKLASLINDKKVKNQIEKLRSRFADVILYNGYTHNDFPVIMENVNIGIVPPQWEDNLPQVTIEMIANGIPVLSSMNGGSKELNSHPDFVFTDSDDLCEKILRIKSNRQILGDYWEYAKTLTTMSMHVHNLKKLYKIL